MTLFAEWIGRVSESVDVVSARMVASFRATLAPHLAPVAEGAAPLGIHWCLSPALAGADELGPDGHPAKALHLPPVPLPRRMWAGGSLEFADMLQIGEEVRRVSTIADITRKAGRSGELWFVAIDHVYDTARGVAIRERQDIVYRAARGAAPEAPAPPGPPGASAPAPIWLIEPTSTLLFRYSALTFNGHRIHYDFPYARNVEGYAGLVVHGPLQATLLLNFAASALGTIPARLNYRGLAPAIGDCPLRLKRGLGAEASRFWTEGADGRIHMEARVEGR